MAKSEELDLGGSSDFDSDFSDDGSLSSSEEISDSHSKSEDLHLYFRQSLSSRIGTTGFVIIGALFFSLIIFAALLLFSYTGTGRNFLQTLAFYIY